MDTQPHAFAVKRFCDGGGGFCAVGFLWSRRSALPALSGFAAPHRLRDTVSSPGSAAPSGFFRTPGPSQPGTLGRKAVGGLQTAPPYLPVPAPLSAGPGPAPHPRESSEEERPRMFKGLKGYTAGKISAAVFSGREKGCGGLAGRPWLWWPDRRRPHPSRPSWADKYGRR